MKLTIAQLQHVLDTYDNGVLSHGSHAPEDGAYCALEAVSLARNNGRDNFTDDPQTLGMPDLRCLNDARWSSDEVRTKALLPFISALSDWSSWSKARQQRWATLVAVRTVNRVVANLPRVSKELQNLCQKAATLVEAKEAAYKVRDAAAASAAYAAFYAAKAASEAAKAASYASEAAAALSDSVLLTAVDIWLSAVSESEKE